MLEWLRNGRRAPLKYALIAALAAILSVMGLEAAGTALSGSYTGLGGKLRAPASVAPAASDHR